MTGPKPCPATATASRCTNGAFPLSAGGEAVQGIVTFDYLANPTRFMRLADWRCARLRCWRRR